MLQGIGHCHSRLITEQYQKGPSNDRMGPKFLLQESTEEAKLRNKKGPKW